jgi:hypothetical protein
MNLVAFEGSSKSPSPPAIIRSLYYPLPAVHHDT